MDGGAATHVAILASPGIGHITPLVELGRRLVSLRGLRVTVFVLAAEASAAQSQLLRSLSIPDGLRLVELPPPTDVTAPVPDGALVETRISLLVRNSLPSLRSVLLEASPPPTALVVDLFGTDAFDVAGDLRMSRYVFFTPNAAVLALMAYSPSLDREVAGEYVDLPGPVRVPGCRPVRTADVVDPMLDRKDDRYRWYLHHACRFPLADGILVNTVEEMDPVPFVAMREEPAFVAIPMPPVYPVGPVIKSAASHLVNSERECLSWLDQQPPGSVLYVSFGSGGTLSVEQTAELAWGLEQSRQRFLWVVRRPAGGDTAAAFFNTGGSSVEDPNDHTTAYMPKGLIAVAEGRGFLVPSWAPQVNVLGHPAVGGFLTHGGWNSVLESITGGVPMIVWPLYAEQKMNAALLAEELRVAVRVRPEGGVVKRDEVERVVRLLMESDEGKAAERKVAELRDRFAAALGEGGSSYEALSAVVTEWKKD